MSTNNVRTASLEKILGAKAESYFNQVEKIQKFVKVPHKRITLQESQTPKSARDTSTKKEEGLKNVGSKKVIQSARKNTV